MFLVVYLVFVYVFCVVFWLILMCLLVSDVVVGSSFELIGVMSVFGDVYSLFEKLICLSCLLVVVIVDMMMLNLCVCSVGIILLKFCLIYMYFVCSCLQIVLCRLMLKLVSELLGCFVLNGGYVGLIFQWIVDVFCVNDVSGVSGVNVSVVMRSFVVWFMVGFCEF